MRSLGLGLTRAGRREAAETDLEMPTASACSGRKGSSHTAGSALINGATLPTGDGRGKPRDFGKHQPRWLRHPSGEDDYQGRRSDEDQEPVGPAGENRKIGGSLPAGKRSDREVAATRRPNGRLELDSNSR